MPPLLLPPAATRFIAYALIRLLRRFAIDIFDAAAADFASFFDATLFACRR